MSIGLPDEESPVTNPPSPGSAGILVVDEDPAFQLGLKTFLREYVGFDKVFVANSGPEALEMIEGEESIDVITLDYQMPGMNGIELLERLRESAPRSLSVMMITGYPSDELEEEFHSLATPTLLTTHFLSKPVEFEKLEPVVLRAHEELLSTRRSSEDPAGENDVAPAMEETGQETGQETGSPGESERFANIESELARHGERLEEVHREVTRLRGRWRADFWKIVLLVVIGWAAIHFDWLDRFQPHWERLKNDMSEAFEPFMRIGDEERTAPAEEPLDEVPSPELPETPVESPSDDDSGVEETAPEPPPADRTPAEPAPTKPAPEGRPL